MHVKTIEVHKDAVMDLFIIEETGHLCTCSLDGTIEIWDIPKSKSIKTITKQGAQIRKITYLASDERKILFAGTDSGKIYLHSIEDVFE